MNETSRFITRISQWVKLILCNQPICTCHRRLFCSRPIHSCEVARDQYRGTYTSIAWWRHQMEIFSALLTICSGHSPVPGEFPAQRPVTRSFDVFFDQRLNKRLSKQSWGWWLETLSRPLWRHCNGLTKMRTWNYIHCFLWDVFTHPYEVSARMSNYIPLFYDGVITNPLIPMLVRFISDCKRLHRLWKVIMQTVLSKIYKSISFLTATQDYGYNIFILNISYILSCSFPCLRPFWRPSWTNSPNFSVQKKHCLQQSCLSSCSC